MAGSWCVRGRFNKHGTVAFAARIEVWRLWAVANSVFSNGFGAKRASAQKVVKDFSDDGKFAWFRPDRPFRKTQVLEQQVVVPEVPERFIDVRSINFNNHCFLIQSDTRFHIFR